MFSPVPTSMYRPIPPSRPETSAAGLVRVLVAHPSELMRTGLVELLRADRVCDLPAGVGSVFEAYRLAAALPTRVVIFDYPRPGGSEAARLLGSLRPRPRLIALVASGTEVGPADPLTAGVDGVVALDGAGRESFGAAVRAILAGNVGVVAGFPGGVATARAVAIGERHGLTAREGQLLYLIGEGLTNREIADLLTLSVKTVETHRGNLARKLGLRSRAGLMRLAMGQAAPAAPSVIAHAGHAAPRAADV